MSSENPLTWEYHQVDHLFLLIGENPLPNYVAAKTLLNEKASIYLVHSTGTATIADRLRLILSKELKEQQIKIYLLNLGASEADANQIRNAITGKAQSLTGKIGLHYTGGTKAMSVHAYQALVSVLKEQNKPYFSYLDPRQLQMRSEDPASGKSIPLTVGLKVQPSLELVFKLHNLKWKSNNPPSNKLILPNIAAEFAKFHADENLWKDWRDWCNTQLRCPENRREDQWGKKDWNEKDESFEKKSLSIENLPTKIKDVLRHHLNTTDREMRLDYTKTVGFKNLKELCQWLDGIWLEHYVLSILQNPTFIDTHKIHESKMSFHIEPPRGKKDRSQFEFDVAFQRGYQLFAISCTTIDSYCKQKLFEAHLRAQQLGGRESRVALVCCYHTPQWLEDEMSFIDIRESQSNQESEKDKYKKKIKVFGRKDLVDLSDKLGKWIEYNKGVE